MSEVLVPLVADDLGWIASNWFTLPQVKQRTGMIMVI